MIHIVVSTCDQYSSVIPKWLAFFYRHWTLPHRVTILGVTPGTLRIPATSADRPIGAIYLKQDAGWAANLLRYLYVLPDDPILMFMDDHILFEVNNSLIQETYEIIQRPDVGCVRLVPWPGPTQPYIRLDSDLAFDYETDNFGEIDKTREYAVSLQASFWKPQTLVDLLDKHWNPWQIELEGSKRAATYPLRFIGCKTCAVNYKDYFMRGKPRPEHAAWVDEHL